MFNSQYVHVCTGIEIFFEMLFMLSTLAIPSLYPRFYLANKYMYIPMYLSPPTIPTYKM
jgi:hypothetical protein